MNEFTLRDRFAIVIIQSIIAADWKFEITDKTWDEMASIRAYVIADEMMRARNE
jgi:hypothetical protein